jgi:hypothetical protein
LGEIGDPVRDVSALECIKINRDSSSVNIRQKFFGRSSNQKYRPVATVMIVLPTVERRFSSPRRRKTRRKRPKSTGTRLNANTRRLKRRPQLAPGLAALQCLPRPQPNTRKCRKSNTERFRWISVSTTRFVILFEPAITVADVLTAYLAEGCDYKLD